jgi:hypothetical protein
MTEYEKNLTFMVVPSSEAFTTQVITPSRLVYSAEIWGKSQAHGALFCGRICRFAAKGQSSAFTLKVASHCVVAIREVDPRLATCGQPSPPKKPCGMGVPPMKHGQDARATPLR